MQKMPAIIPVVFLLYIGWVAQFQFAVCSEGPSCSIKLNGDLPKTNEPIMLKKKRKHYSLFIPTVNRHQGVIELKRGEELVLACPGENNYLNEIEKHTVNSKCVSDTTLCLNSCTEVFITKNASCKHTVRAIVKKTTRQCARVGIIYEIGFEAHGWHLLVTVCHDPLLANTLFTKHVLFGSAILGSERKSGRPLFNASKLDELYGGYNPNDYYEKKSQENLFKNVVGTVRKSIYYEKNRKFLARGHLAPNADFIFKTWRYATFFYINAAPQWQVINAQNWTTVENLARKLGIKLSADLTIVTGTHKIMDLQNKSNVPQKLYLNYERNTIPVPLYFWKIIYYTKTKHAISLVTLNNPYVPRNTKIPFCKDICLKNGWAHTTILENFQNVTKGLTVCCTYNELKTEVPHVPFLNVKGILRGPHI